MPIIPKKKELPEASPASSQKHLLPEGRDKELASKPTPHVRKLMTNLYSSVENGFEDQGQRADDNAKWWDIYNCQLSDQQYYSGNSQIFVPIAYDAINARKTRFTNQIFPQNNRFVQVITEDGEIPDATMALMEKYIRINHLRNSVIPALMKCGDVEGQYTIYVDWATRRKDVVYRSESPVALDATELDLELEVEDSEEMELLLPDPDETVMELKEQKLDIGFPSVEVINDNDLLVLPATASSIDEALECGGSVTVIRRWSQEVIEQKIVDKEIDKEAGESLIAAMVSEDRNARRDLGKQMLDAAGIKRDSRGTYALVYETWSKMTIGGKRRIYRCYFGGSKSFLSCKRNPYWSDNIPVISTAVNKVNGSFKGKSLVEPIATFQYAANDAANEGMDSAAYAMLPIIMTDPEKNPRVGSMVLSLAAIWMTNPNDTQFAQFPQLWKDAFEIVGSCRAQIFQSLSVNPASITQGTPSSKKPSQADIANEQQVDILTTADAVSTIEEGILTPMLHRFLELDHQFRDKEVTVIQHGRMGIKANMEKVPLTNLQTTHYMKWFGVEAARNVQAIQQQIAAANILRGIPPQFYQGYRLNLIPVITQLVENAFGPTLAPLIFESLADQFTIDPEIENELMMRGQDLPVMPLDNFQMHIQAHMAAMQQTGDPHGVIMPHIMKHMAAAAAMGQQAMMGGVPGTPGGAAPGLPGEPAGQPRIGAQPGQATGTQGPPGMIAQDSMQDPSVMPRL